MKLSSLSSAEGPFLGFRREDGIVDLNAEDASLPRELGALLRSGRPLAAIAELGARARPTSLRDPAMVRFRPIILDLGKILCLGVNYADHAAEASQKKPDHAVVFGRYPSSFVGHEQPLVRPSVSTHFDYEAEIVAVIGTRAHRVPRERALDHVVGYTLMNDGTIRDYQKRTPQWTLGKNFDASGAIGPELVTADELPPGATGLSIRGVLNGKVMQDANTSDMIFGVADAVAQMSEAMTLEPGDLIAMGTPGGVGFVRTPPVFLQPGDVFEVIVERVGTLRNGVVAEEA
jgi:2-keto-4-pentenoate hydratase/2-oxohepta-3-ene-1,7-dioic acid hydratase in catechol pathway